MTDKIKEILLKTIYTPDSKPRFVGGDVETKLQYIDEAVKSIESLYKENKGDKIYIAAGELLSVDSEGLTLQEMLDAIIAQNKIDGTVMVDSLEGVYMWEKLEWSFSCRNFLKEIGLI